MNAVFIHFILLPSRKLFTFNSTNSDLLLLLLEYVYPTEQVQLRDRRIAREKKYIQKTLPKDVKRMLMYVIIFAHGI
jgi:hypothetical protein